MDLDNEELEATKKLNGTSKENSIEEDIRRCKELIKTEHANWLGISNQTAIEHILADRERLQKENKELKQENYVQKIVINEKYISKDIIKEKIEELIKIIEDLTIVEIQKFNIEFYPESYYTNNRKLKTKENY